MLGDPRSAQGSLIVQLAFVIALLGLGVSASPVGADPEVVISTGAANPVHGIPGADHSTFHASIAVRHRARSDLSLGLEIGLIAWSPLEGPLPGWRTTSDLYRGSTTLAWGDTRRKVAPHIGGSFGLLAYNGQSGRSAVYGTEDPIANARNRSATRHIEPFVGGQLGVVFRSGRHASWLFLAEWNHPMGGILEDFTVYRGDLVLHPD
jgi:hypothetical protein